MGIYGNLNEISRSGIQYDKIYHNRKEMDANASTDNIMFGRYVLIEYGSEFLELSTQSYTDTIGGALSDYQGNLAIDKYYQTSSTANGGLGIKTTPLDNYDSTLWQKIYTSNGEKYQMVARLNAEAPTIDGIYDAPSDNLSTTVISSIIDNKSTTTNYYLHIPTSWEYEFTYDADTLNAEGYKPENRYIHEEDGLSHTMSITVSTNKTEKRDYKTITISDNKLVESTKKQNYLKTVTLSIPVVKSALSDFWDTIYGPGIRKTNSDGNFLNKNNEPILNGMYNNITYNSEVANRDTTISRYVYDTTNEEFKFEPTSYTCFKDMYEQALTLLGVPSDTYSWAIDSNNNYYNSDGYKIDEDGNAYVTEIVTPAISATINTGVILCDKDGNELTTDDINIGETYYKYTLVKAEKGEDNDYWQESANGIIYDGITLYDKNGTKVEAENIVAGETYYLFSDLSAEAVEYTDYEAPYTKIVVKEDVILRNSKGDEVDYSKLNYVSTYYKYTFDTIAVKNTDYTEPVEAVTKKIILSEFKKYSIWGAYNGIARLLRAAQSGRVDWSINDSVSTSDSDNANCIDNHPTLIQADEMKAIWESLGGSNLGIVFE